IGGEFFTQEEVDALIATGKFPEEPKTGRAPPSFASTQAAQAQAETFAREQAQRDAALAAQAATLASQRAAERDKLDREFREEQNRLAEEAALKRGRLSTLTDLIQSFVGAQSQARDTLANLQPDPFRFAAVAGGIAPFGVTPQQGFQQQLQQFASAPAPTVDPNASLPSIESAIQGLTGANVPLPPQVFSAAGGASIPAPPPGQSIAVKVGERGEEVLRITAQGVEVIPLSGGMQAGGTIGFPFQPVEFDTETLLPALGTSGIFSDFNRIPFAQSGRKFGPFGDQRSIRGIFEGREGEFGSAVNPLGADPFKASTLESLGIAPGLVRFGTENAIFFRNPITGELQQFSLEQFQGGGFDMANVVNIRPEDRGQFQFGPRLGPSFDPSQSAGTQGVSAFTKFAAPIIEPTTGTLLPAPFAVAEQLNRLRVTNPTAFNLLLSAYTTAGVPVAAVLSSIGSSLSFGSERGAVGLR
ncbi:hypothetical protein LCGC14_2545370, partial [marine sediment metagenome]